MIDTELIPGKIYFISYGKQTQLVVRFKETKTCEHHFFDHLHYWNGSEHFHKNGYGVKNGIEEIRPATLPEKHLLIRFEIEGDCI